MNTPNKNNIKLWVDALRSGEFSQTQRAMHRAGPLALVGDDYLPAGHCCLGVACEIAVKNGLDLDDWSSAGYLPYEAMDWLGFNSINPIIAQGPTLGEPAHTGDITAAFANDALGWTFDQIADAVEKRFLTEDAPIG